MSSFQKWLLWASSALTGATGLIYWWMTDWMQPLDEFAVINHPLQPLILKAHIVAAPALVFAVGLITVGHIWKQYKRPVSSGRSSGLLSMWVLGPLIMTGYSIQVVTHVGWLEALAWAHLATGGLYLVGLFAHHRAVRHLWVLRVRTRKAKLETSEISTRVGAGADPFP
jgi:hypothetical protein